MRCLSCDAILEGHELNRRGKNTGEFVDMCDSCIVDITDVVFTPDAPESVHDADAEDENGLADYFE